MSFRKVKTQLICLECDDLLTHYASIQLEVPGREASIYTYQWFKCENCGKTYYGSLEEFLDVFDDDLVHIGYLAEPEKWEKSFKSLKSCPDLEYKSCKCKIHQKFANEGFDGIIKSIPMSLRSYKL